MALLTLHTHTTGLQVAKPSITPEWEEDENIPCLQVKEEQDTQKQYYDKGAKDQQAVLQGKAV